jgi:hypothetical protein
MTFIKYVSDLTHLLGLTTNSIAVAKKFSSRSLCLVATRSFACTTPLTVDQHRRFNEDTSTKRSILYDQSQYTGKQWNLSFCFLLYWRNFFLFLLAATTYFFFLLSVSLSPSVLPLYLSGLELSFFLQVYVRYLKLPLTRLQCFYRKRASHLVGR